MAKKTRRDEPNDITEMWRDVRRDQAARRQLRRSAEADRITDLAEQGYAVQELTDCHFRINGTLDLFPTNQRYHFIPTNTRGRYTEAAWCAVRFLGKAKR